MKNLKKLFLLVLLVGIIASTTSVKAITNTIQLGASRETKRYIGGIGFHYKVTTDNKYLYCLNNNKDTAENITANLVQNSKVIDGGITYILENGYPVKTITNDEEKDYYITQSAIWWYLDKTTGSANLPAQFKEGSDEYNIKKYILDLVEEGYKHRNDDINENTKVNIEIKSNELKIKDNFYISDEIKVKGNNENIISIENIKEDIYIILSDNKEFKYNGEFVIKNNESFRIKTSTNTTTDLIKITARTKNNHEYKAYEFEPTDKTMQNVTLVEKIEKPNSVITLSIKKQEVIVPNTNTTTSLLLFIIGILISTESILYIKNNENRI